MALTQHQKAILEYVADKEKTKSQIVNKFNAWHYGESSSRLIGEMLSRMVDRGLLIRVKKGVFKRGPGITINSKSVNIDKDQLSIF
jgi:hypothetical protein